MTEEKGKGRGKERRGEKGEEGRRKLGRGMEERRDERGYITRTERS